MRFIRGFRNKSKHAIQQPAPTTCMIQEYVQIGGHLVLTSRPGGTARDANIALARGSANNGSIVWR